MWKKVTLSSNTVALYKYALDGPRCLYPPVTDQKHPLSLTAIYYNLIFEQLAQRSTSLTKMVQQTVQSDGIFHGVPTFPDHDGKSYTAIVTGANGISGAHILRTLSAAPERWSRIYALSRKPPNFELSDNVTFISIDFLDAPEKIAKTLQDNKVSA
jgi:hypothetical protein